MRGLGSMILLGFLALLLRSTALSALAARGLVLDVLAFVTVVWALRYRETVGATLGFALGLAADLDAAHWLGRHALCLALLGYGTGRLSHTLVRDSSRTQLALLFVGTAAHQIWAAAFEFGGFESWPFLLQRVGLACLVTPLVGTFVIGVMRRMTGRPLFGHGTLATGSSA